MRVRPFFWVLFACVCISMLTLAATIHIPVPAEFHVQLTQRPTPETPLVLRVHVTDAQGLTVDDAQILSQAWMTNMPMKTSTITAVPEQPGTYLVRFPLFMEGPWMIALSLQADGFVPLRQTLLVQVPSQPTLVCLLESVPVSPLLNSLTNRHSHQHRDAAP
jgi:hypothetical protein